MWPFSNNKKAVEISSEAKAKYISASVEELKREASALSSTSDNPSLSTGEHVKLFAAAATLSPEAIAGQLIGTAAQAAVLITDPQKISHGGLKALHKAGASIPGMIVTNVGIPVLFGLNAYRRYVDDAHTTQMEEKQVKLTYVEKLIAEHEATAIAKKSR